jgi:hypothetical protein
VVVDLFAGSGNTLYWIRRHAGARRGIGFELDPAGRNAGLLLATWGWTAA